MMYDVYCVHRCPQGGGGGKSIAHPSGWRNCYCGQLIIEKREICCSVSVQTN